MTTTVTMSALEVADPERSARFYTEALGLKRVQDVTGSDFEAVLVGSPGGRGAMLELARHHGREGGVEHGSGFWKLCLSTGDVAGLYGSATAAGARPVSPPRPLPGLESMSFALVEDPDGYLVELVGPASG
ncbi:VOC family protein [Nocardiopsis changdeensis]|uniref:VOC family protein n=1 Tax=Nocardiopsis changdeensis TaxID=2831969 RepID=UPI003F47FFA3